MNLPNGLHREVREAAQHLVTLGFKYEGIGRNGHLRFLHADYGKSVLPFSPSRQFQDSHRSEIAKAMGISKYDLELRLGLRQPKREGPKVKRQRNDEGRRARTFHHFRASTDAPGAQARVGTPAERMKEIAAEIGAIKNRMGYLHPDSDEYASLLNENCCLTREYIESENAAKETAK